MAVTGLAAGTRVLTLDGALPVEHLLPGDRIVTRDRGAVPLHGIDRWRARTRAVRFAAPPGTDVPALILPAAQPVLVRDGRSRGRLCPAADLVDGRAVIDCGVTGLVLLALRFAAAHVIYAGGHEIAVTPSAAEAAGAS